MKITKIEPQKRNDNRVNIYCDEEYKFSLTKNGLVDFYIFNGKEITNNEIEEIKKKDDINYGMNIALNYLSHGMKTKKEIENKLIEKEITIEYISSIIEKLISYKYINDELYTQMYIKTKALPKGWGLQKIISTLYPKGIEKEMIKNIYEELTSTNETIDNVYEIALKKWNSLSKEKDNKKKKEKIARFLLSKGHSWDKINEIIRQIEKNN